MISKLNWENQTITIRTLIRALEEGEYDLNPDHQREVVHDQEWKSELITSIYDVGCIPETWWHPVKDNNLREYYESVDGKQRTSTILDFHQGKITWKGQKYTQLSIEQQNEFLGHKLSLRIANRTLTPEEIARIFEKLQRVKQTTLGEVLHSHRYPLTEQLEQLISRHDRLLIKMKIKNNRHQKLEAYGKSLDYWVRYLETDSPPSGSVCETDTVEITWENKKGGLSDSELTQYEELMKYTWEVFTEPNEIKVPRKMQCGNWLPVFALFCETSPEDYLALRLYLNNNLVNIVNDETIWPNVGGNHKALAIRKDILKQQFITHDLDI
tara:strand:- start:528 stop:1505 length:978 start_codon:yes stop_codon:yes gene_type:complete